jgi:hypothetical protein
MCTRTRSMVLIATTAAPTISAALRWLEDIHYSSWPNSCDRARAVR